MKIFEREQMILENGVEQGIAQETVQEKIITEAERISADTYKKELDASKLQTQYTLSESINLAIDECINNDVLKDILISQREEVLQTMLYTFNQELYESNLKKNSYEQGLEDGIAQERVRTEAEKARADEERNRADAYKKELDALKLQLAKQP